MKKLINQYKKWNPSIYATLLLMVTPFLIYLFIDFKLDNDFWFLIKTGKTILEEGFIRVETFTIHEGLTFIPQQWLVDIVFNFIYQNFNIQGMYYLVIILNMVILYLCYRLCLLVSNSKKKAIIIAVITDIILIVLRFITTRPQLFDIVILLIELLLLESFIIKNNKKYLYFIPLLSLFSINLHASVWSMLFVFMIPYFVEYGYLKLKKRDTFKIKPLIIIFFISILVGFINPYGIDAIKYLFNSYGVKEINNIVNEMKTLDITSTFGLSMYALIFFILYSFYHNKKNNKTRYFLLSMGIIYLSFSHVRGLLFLLIISPLILGYNFKSNNKEINVKVLLYEKIVYVILITISMLLIITNIKLKENVDVTIFADYLDKNASHDIRLFTDYDNGSYMEYRGYKCYIDPRAEVFLKSNNHKEDIFQEYYLLEKNELDVKEFLNKYNFDYLLVDDRLNNLLKELKENKDYEEVLSKTDDNKNNEEIYLFKKVNKK